MRLSHLRALVALASVLIALVCLEAGLRVVLPQEVANGNYWGKGAFVGDTTLGYRHAPGFRGRALRPGVFSSHVVISESGLRQERAARQLDFPRRLLVLGDSFPFGLGVEEQQSFPHLLQGPLNHLGVGIVNGAQTGYQPTQMIEFGRRLLEENDYDFVLLCLYPDNDLDAEYYRDHERVEVFDGYRLSKGRWLAGTSLDLLRTRSYTWMQLASRLQRRLQVRRRAAFVALTREAPHTVLKPMVLALQEFKELSSVSGFHPIVVVIPGRSRKNRFLQELVDAGLHLSLEVVDLSSAGLTDEDYFVGDGHWNGKGHAKVARWLSSHLTRLLTGRSDATGPSGGPRDLPPGGISSVESATSSGTRRSSVTRNNVPRRTFRAKLSSRASRSRHLRSSQLCERGDLGE